MTHKPASWFYKPVALVAAVLAVLLGVIVVLR